MRIETIVAPAILAVAIVALPGAALAVQIAAIVLAIAPVLVLAARARRGPGGFGEARAAPEGRRARPGARPSKL